MVGLWTKIIVQNQRAHQKEREKERLRFSIYKKLKEGSVPFIGTSTTLTPDIVAHIMGNTLLMQAPLTLGNIHFSVFSLTSQVNSSLTEAACNPTHGQPANICEYIQYALSSM